MLQKGLILAGFIAAIAATAPPTWALPCSTPENDLVSRLIKGHPQEGQREELVAAVRDTIVPSASISTPERSNSVGDSMCQIVRSLDGASTELRRDLAQLVRDFEIGWRLNSESATKEATALIYAAFKRAKAGGELDVAAWLDSGLMRSDDALAESIRREAKSKGDLTNIRAALERTSKAFQESDSADSVRMHIAAASEFLAYYDVNQSSNWATFANGAASRWPSVRSKVFKADYEASRRVYEDLLSDIRKSSDLERQKLITTILFRLSVNALVAGDLTFAKERITDIKSNSRLPNQYLNHIYVGRPVSIRTNTAASIRLLPAPTDGFVSRRLVNPLQLAAVLRGIVEKIESQPDRFSFGWLVETLYRIDNFDYRVFFGSFRNESEALALQRRYQEVVERSDVREGIAAAVAPSDSTLYPPDGCELEFQGSVEKLPRVPAAVRLATPGPGGGLFGVWIGGCLNAEEAKKIIAVLQAVQRAPAAPYLWRFKVF